MPADAAVTKPDVELTVATPVLTLLHVPLPAASASNEVIAGQAFSEPVIVPALGDGLTVNTEVAAAVPQLLVTV